MPAISVIVPVYRVEDKIRRCINSLLEQSFTDYELILVDDGSPDLSGKICDEYAELYNRIHVIHQNNGGVSRARNAGVAAACGDYIAFVDSDDYVHPDYLRVLHHQALEAGADIVMCNYYMVDSSMRQERYSHGYADGTLLDRSGIERVLYGHIIQNDNTTGYFSLWNKLFRKALISEYAVWLDEDMSFGEDMLWVMDCLTYCRNIMFVDDSLYYYQQTENGLFGSYRPSFLSDIVKCYNRFIEQLGPFFSATKDDLNLNFKYYNYICRHFRGIVMHEHCRYKQIRAVLKNETVKQIFRKISRLPDDILQRHGISRCEKRVLWLTEKNLTQAAAAYLYYLYNDTCILRRLRHTLCVVGSVVRARYCSKMRSLYWSLKTGNVFIIAPKTKIILGKNAQIKIHGSLHLNLCWEGRQNQPATLVLGENAKLAVSGNFRFYSGAYISIADNATLAVGSGFVNNNGKISCFDKIVIGDDVKISEDVALRDSDNHSVCWEGYRKSAPIIIGNHVWIGMRAMLLKGVNVGDGAIIAAGCIVTKSLPPRTLTCGIPGKVVKQNIEWE